MIVDALVLAVRHMARNPGRTALTSLGVLIGVAAVITMVSVGQGATARVEQDLSSLGGHLLFVVPGTQSGMGSRTLADALTLQDAEVLGSEVPDVVAVAPLTVANVVAVRDDLTWRTEVRGSTGDFHRVMNQGVAHGRRFTEGEERSGESVCVLGQTVLEALFPSSDPVGTRLRLADATCDVVGVLEARGENSFGMDQDDFVLMPIRAVQRRFTGNNDVSTLFVLLEEKVDGAVAIADIQSLMDHRRHVPQGGERDYTVRDMAEMAAMLDQISTVLTSFLGAVAGVSLLVGGIGIMNIMLVSVAERTREIGIRLAVGAQAKDVLLQFLVESTVLSLVGGLAGVIVAVALSAALSAWLEVAFVMDLRIVGLSVGVAGLVGIGFGFWPARRAARMKPIDALRHE